MATSKSVGSSSLRDPDSGDKANIGTKVGGEKALHVISSINNTSITTDLNISVPAGLITDAESINKFGSNTSVSKNSFETIWDNGGRYDWSAFTSAGTLSISSSQNSDNSSGNGARTIEVIGLDANYDPLTETISMNGTVAVTSTNSFLRVYRAKVLTAGSSETNNGSIDIELGGSVAAMISAGLGQSLTCTYTVRAGYSAYMTQLYWSSSIDKENKIRLLVREPNEVFVVKGNFESGGGYYQKEYSPYFKIPEKSDIEIIGKSGITAHSISAGFDLFLFKD